MYLGIEASEGDWRSYLEIAEVVEVHSPRASIDLTELYRSIVFSALTANTDDHLRNHGFLRTNNGWRLAPAYDLNANPDDPGHLTTAIDLDDSTCNLDLVVSVASYFRLSDDDAKAIVVQVEMAPRDWRGHANTLGLTSSDIDRMEEAFDSEFRVHAARLSAPKGPKPSAHPQPRTNTGNPQPRLADGRFSSRPAQRATP